jgi:hypothetical protein
MTGCSQTYIPELNQIPDPCKGEHVSTACVYKEGAIPYLTTDANASLDTILQDIVLALQASNARIGILEAQIADLQSNCCGQIY